jgi:hypothetical protein
MNAPIGFVLLTHAHPDQALRLVSRLNAMFDHPPIAWHHDFTRSALDPGRVPDNAALVRPHVRTAWAEFSIVEATMRAVRQLYDGAAPDWFVILSGADYPIKSADRILGDLRAGGYDAHIEHELIAAPHFAREWQRELHNRYCASRTVRVPWVTRRLRVTRRTLRVTHPLLLRWLLPFSATFRCYAGPHWFSGNRRAAEHLLAFHASRPRLAAHHRPILFPEESYFQCALANAPHLRLNDRNYRYVEWPEDGDASHPKTLTRDDLPALLASPCHFARKFDPAVDAAVLDALDTAVGAAPRLAVERDELLERDPNKEPWG